MLPMLQDKQFRYGPLAKREEKKGLREFGARRTETQPVDSRRADKILQNAQVWAIMAPNCTHSQQSPVRSLNTEENERQKLRLPSTFTLKRSS